MTNRPLRVRFAPSPTGYLHIGGARTALFNFLLARRHQGTFVLRIEDTDNQRNTEAARQAIINGMQWLGITWDEGPFHQSQRMHLYQAAAKSLISEGKAYYCNCSVEVLEEKRKAAMAAGRKPMYDGTCRERGLAETGCVVRFKAPTSGVTVVNDLIKGRVEFNNSELDDMVLVRADGMPTYNFVVVVDDADMNITDVIRGDDHLNNTPKQIQLYEALGKPVPNFAHVPLILGQDKSRLSKRHGATAVDAYRDEGYLPEAMLNFLVRLGWSHGDQEIFSMEEMIKLFDLEHVGKSAGVFNQEKLLWLNHHYLKQKPLAELTELVRPFIKQGAERLNDPAWALLAPELGERCKLLPEYFEQGHFFFVDELSYGSDALKFLNTDVSAPLSALVDTLKGLSQFDEKSIENAFGGLLEKLGIKLKILAQPVRVALTGSTTSPGIYRLIHILGQKRTLQRLQKAVEFIKQKGQ